MLLLDDKTFVSATVLEIARTHLCPTQQQMQRVQKFLNTSPKGEHANK
jgi:hypothetical protein